MSKTKKLVKNTLFKGTSQLSITLSHLILIPVVIKYLGTEGLGMMAIFKLLTPEGPVGLLEFGFQSSLSPLAAQLQAQNKGDSLSRITGYLLLLYTFIGFLTLSILFIPSLRSILGLFDLPELVFQTLLIYTLLSNLYSFPKLILQGLLEGLQNYKVISVTDGLQIILTNMGQVFLLMAGFGLKELIVFEVVLGGIAALLYLKFAFPFISFKPFALEEKNHFNALLKTSKLVFIGKFSGILSSNFDKIVITKFFGPHFLGVFEIMTKLPKFLRIFTSIGTLAVTPMAASLYAKNDHKKLNWLFEKGLFLNMAINAGIIFNAIVYLPSFFNIWIGPEFSKYISGTQLLLVWTYFFLFNIGWSMLFGINRLIGTATAINWSGTIVKIIVFFLTYKWLGENAIIAAYLIPQIFAFVGLFYFVREFEMTWSRFVRDFSISLFCFVPSLIFSLLVLGNYQIKNYFDLLALSGLSTAIYFAFVYFSYPDREVIKNLVIFRFNKKSL